MKWKKIILFEKWASLAISELEKMSYKVSSKSSKFYISKNIIIIITIINLINVAIF